MWGRLGTLGDVWGRFEAPKARGAGKIPPTTMRRRRRVEGAPQNTLAGRRSMSHFSIFVRRPLGWLPSQRSCCQRQMSLSIGNCKEAYAVEEHHRFMGAPKIDTHNAQTHASAARACFPVHPTIPRKTYNFWNSFGLLELSQFHVSGALASWVLRRFPALRDAY